VSLRPTIIVLGLLVVAELVYWAWLLGLPEERQLADRGAWMNSASFVALPLPIAAFVFTAAVRAFGRDARHDRPAVGGR
jgi:cytochrome bd-type quinol oxidase subunit 1